MTQRVSRTGVVKAIQGSMAVAVTRREAECEHCQAKDSCESMGGTGANIEVRARNTAQAQVGDIVTISMRSTSVLKASFYIYMVPVIGLIGGIIAGFFVSKSFGLDEEVSVAVFSLAALAGSFLWLKSKAKAFSQRAEFTPEIVATQSPSKDIPPANPNCLKT